MALVGGLAPLVVMGVASVLTLSTTPNDVIVSDTTPKAMVRSNMDDGVSVANEGDIGLRSIGSMQEGDTELPSVDLPVVEVKVVNEEVEKINKVTVEAPVLGQIGVKGFKTVSLGEFKVTAYCGGKCCNRGGNTEGMRSYDSITVAVDPNIVPYGTMLLIDGVGIRQAQPSTQKLSGNHIKVYVPNHNQVSSFGEKVVKVVKVI